MKAQKVTVTIVVEGLSIDIVSGMVAKAIEQVQREVESGVLFCEDGDTVRWNTERTQVNF